MNLSTEKKIELLTAACQIAVEQESRGHLLDKFAPQVQIVLSVFDNDQTAKMAEPRLVYPDGKVGEPANWSGMGGTYDEALTAGLWCIRYELEERVLRIQKMLKKLRAAAPIEGDPPLVDMNAVLAAIPISAIGENETADGSK